MVHWKVSVLGRCPSYEMSVLIKTQKCVHFIECPASPLCRDSLIKNSLVNHPFHTFVSVLMEVLALWCVRLKEIREIPLYMPERGKVQVYLPIFTKSTTSPPSKDILKNYLLAKIGLKLLCSFCAILKDYRLITRWTIGFRLAASSCRTKCWPGRTKGSGRTTVLTVYLVAPGEDEGRTIWPVHN